MADIVFRLADVPPGSSLLVGNADSQNAAVFNVDGKFCATQTHCTHKQASLFEGTITGSVVTCPYHGSQFDVSTGAVLRGPAIEPLESYPVEVEGEVGRIRLSG
jgi:nitrite reductase/ring-hydroxylating ferredoxin subunit